MSSCARCGGRLSSSGISAGMSARPIRNCSCGNSRTGSRATRDQAAGISAGMTSSTYLSRQPNASTRHSRDAVATGISAGMTSSHRVNQSAYNYGLRPASYGNRDVKFIAGILVGISIALVGVAIFAFLI